MRHRQFDPYKNKKEDDRKLAERGKEARGLREMGSARAFDASNGRNAREAHASQTRRAKSVSVTLPKAW